MHAAYHRHCDGSAAGCQSVEWLRVTLSALEALTGHRIPGGCDDCDAYQTVKRLPADQLGSVYVLTVHHDSTCPHLNGAA